MFEIKPLKAGSTAGLLLILLILSACAGFSAPPEDDSPTPFSPATQGPLPTASPLVPTAEATVTAAPSPTAINVSDFPDPAGYTWTILASGLDRPVGLVSPQDGSGRLFLIEQRGRILILSGPDLLEAPFLDIRGRVGSSGNEQGLLGLAFAPDYPESGAFYINYTDNSGDTVISRFQVSSDPDRADGSSEEILLRLPQPYQNHNGGQIRFGPQGMLWIASGDGGGSGDPLGKAQNLDSPLGKLLRIDVNQSPYALPPDNPFGNEIWAYGLRNPWRFTFDPATGNLFIADVGQNQWEEINFLPAGSPAGANFGWNFKEGSHPYQGTPGADLSLLDPVFEYDHTQGCSISGGAVYRGAFQDWGGIYLFGDFCSGQIWGLLQGPDGEWAAQPLFSTDRRIAAIDQDQAGEVYLVDIRGTVLKLVAR